MYKQTYENYYKDYFKTESGRFALMKAREKWLRKLEDEYPGIAINEARRLRREAKSNISSLNTVEKLQEGK